MMQLVIDGILVLVIVVLAWRSLNDRDLFRAVIKFIVLGLLMAVAWVPAVARAGRCSGRGGGGLRPDGRAHPVGPGPDAATREGRRRSTASRWRWHDDSPRGHRHSVTRSARGAGLGCSVAARETDRAYGRSLVKLPESGVTNPVTAVLLNYRGYDTPLEVGVLLLAIAGAWCCAAEMARRRSAGPPAADVAAARLLPVLVLSAGYLLWIGVFAPGGAFQGGALLGGRSRW